jgi:hypothetical protein
MTNKLFEDEEIVDNNDIQIPEEEPLKPFLEKYKDPMGIAKALLEKDRFINQLKSETAGLRSELTTRSRVEETVDRLLNNKPITQNTPAATDPAGTNGTGDGSSTKGLTEEDVRKLLEAERAKLTAEKNVEIAKSKLQETFGADWQKVLVQKGKEIGESAEFFDALARKNPNALLALVGSQQAQKPASQPSLTGGSVNTTQSALGSGQSVVRDQKYYNALKAKLGPAEFFKPAIQNQMHKDAIEQGPSFFN